MNWISRSFLIFFLLGLMATGCRKKAFDDYYGRPSSLEPPIYQTLQAKGRFTNLLAAIDKSGYKSILSAAGYWTMFAPNDAAFQAYFTQTGISGIAAMDSNACRQIVTYCLVYNAFNKDRIDDFQGNLGWQTNIAFKRKTAAYTGVYDGTNTAGAAIKAIASNRNNNGVLYYAEADNNNKYVPIYTDTFFKASSLTNYDYNYFYPGATFSGFNVADAQVLEKNIPAENGVVHEINKVITALPSIDQYLASKPEYSEFKKLFDKYLVQYVFNQTVTQHYQAQTGSTAQVYTKVFNSALAYSPNNEAFLRLQDNDSQTNGYTLFVPTNAVLLNYINTVLLENYTSLDAMPIGIIYDFVNAHMWQATVWPSKFSTTLSYLKEEARFDPNTDIIDKKMLSNGIFYGTNKVQQANVFTTVYGRVYLDPNYTIMQQLMNAELRPIVSNPSQKYTIFMMSNAAIAAAGYVQDITLNADPNLQWRYTPSAAETAQGAVASTGSAAYNRLLRILNMCVVPTPAGELNDLSGSGVASSYGGEFIRYNANTVYAAGNVDVGNVVNITGSKTSSNGKVYYCNKLLNFSEKTIGKHIELIGTPAASVYNSFWQYLKNSTIYNATTGEIQGVSAGLFYTVFIPTNAKITLAVNEGWLPGTGTFPNMVPNFNPTLPAEQDKVAKFLQYHILNKKTVGTDGKESGSYEGVLKKNNGDPTAIFVNNTTVGAMKLTDMDTPPRYGNVILANSNYLSNRCLIHLIDNYLRYTL